MDLPVVTDLSESIYALLKKGSFPSSNPTSGRRFIGLLFSGSLP